MELLGMVLGVALVCSSCAQPSHQRSPGEVSWDHMKVVDMSYTYDEDTLPSKEGTKWKLEISVQNDTDSGW